MSDPGVGHTERATRTGKSMRYGYMTRSRRTGAGEWQVPNSSRSGGLHALTRRIRRVGQHCQRKPAAAHSTRIGAINQRHKKGNHQPSINAAVTMSVELYSYEYRTVLWYRSFVLCFTSYRYVLIQICINGPAGGQIVSGVRIWVRPANPVWLSLQYQQGVEGGGLPYNPREICGLRARVGTASSAYALYYKYVLVPLTGIQTPGQATTSVDYSLAMAHDGEQTEPDSSSNINVQTSSRL